MAKRQIKINSINSNECRDVIDSEPQRILQIKTNHICMRVIAYHARVCHLKLMSVDYLSGKRRI